VLAEVEVRPERDPRNGHEFVSVVPAEEPIALVAHLLVIPLPLFSVEVVSKFLQHQARIGQSVFVYEFTNFGSARV